MSRPSLTMNAGAFVPVEIADYMGHFDRVPAQIKTAAEHFRVEEQQPHVLCTISPGTDNPQVRQDHNGGGKVLTGLILAKNKMTTFDAVYQAAQKLGIDKHRVSYAGLKDRWAQTAQLIVVEGLTVEEAARVCNRQQQPLNGHPGFFLKDPHPVSQKLFKGNLVGNRFTIKVSVPGMSAQQIEEYITPRLQHLRDRGGVFPNALNRQRLGRRQNGLEVGYTLLTQGAEAAVKLFLTDTSPSESPYATEIRSQLAKEWEAAAAKARETGGTVAEQWMYWFNMRELLVPVHKKLNMAIEFKIVEEVLTHQCFIKTMQRMKDEFSLWVGAWQGFWYNQVLAKVLRGEFQLNGNSIPLLTNEPSARRFYETFCPEAILSVVDADVERIFLDFNPGGHRNARGFAAKRKGPRRQAFIPVQDFEQSFADGWWNVSFMLRSGSYATTFLGLLFDLDGDDATDAVANS